MYSWEFLPSACIVGSSKKAVYAIPGSGSDTEEVLATTTYFEEQTLN